jgi:chromosome segregation ATPase
LEKDVCQANLENHQLRLEVHRWRKQHALIKLRLAGAQEDLDLQGAHSRQLESRCESLEGQRTSLAAQLEDARLQLAEARVQLLELADLKAGAQQEATRLKV